MTLYIFKLVVRYISKISRFVKTTINNDDPDYNSNNHFYNY